MVRNPNVWVIPLTTLALLTASCSGSGDSASNTTSNGSGPGQVDADQDPGRVTIHRLNRAEYNNTVRDLLGTEQRPADDFPADDIGHGFDNNADVLSLSPLQLELYERAAEALIDEALAVPPTEPDLFMHEAEDITSDVGGAFEDSGWNLWSNGTLEVLFPSLDGEYRFSVRAFGQQAGDEPAQMVFNLNGRVLQTFDVTAVRNSPEVYTFTMDLEAGNNAFSAEFINDYYVEEANEDRNLIVDWISIEGPLDLPEVSTDKRDRILLCAPEAGAEEACARRIIASFARRAWRRSIDDSEVDQLIPLFQLGMEENANAFDEAIKLPLQAVLLSTHFIFRVELDPDPNNTTPHALSDFELASRLSYFLWSSMPDDTLLDLAQQGALNNDAELRRQVARMLDDPRSQALVENFAGQWLFTRALVDVQPDYNIFPSFDEELRASMQIETEMYFEEFLRSDRSIEEMLTARFTYINDRLARHYGLDAPSQEGFERVETNGPRQGLLGHAGLLMVTSYPTRTSPVKRGKWLLTQLLCSEPPAPPPGVEGLIEPEEPSGTLREQLEQHRADPTCAACHQLMDPLGFGLEHFDGIGVYRLEDTHGFPIDATGTLPTGESFSNANAMANIIAQDPNFARCVAWQMYTYALGRGVESSDTLHLRTIRTNFADNGHRLQALLEAIALSPAFRTRRGQGQEVSEPSTGGE